MKDKSKSHGTFDKVFNKGYYMEFDEIGNVFLNNKRTGMKIKLINKYIPNILTNILINPNSDTSYLFDYLKEKSEQDILLEINNIINEKKCECLHYYINTDYDETKPYCWAFTHVYQDCLIPNYETCEEIKNCPVKNIMSKMGKGE